LYIFSSGGEIKVNGGKYIAHEDYKSVVVNFDSNSYGTESGIDSFKNNHNGMAAVVTIENGEFCGEFEKAGSGSALTDIVVKGGTFSFDPTSYVDSGKYNVTQNTSNNTWTVSAK